MSDPGSNCPQNNRRAFLRDGSLLLFAAGSACAASMGNGNVDAGDLQNELEGFALRSDDERRIRIGLVTDLHFADKAPAGSRHYRETSGKLAEASKHFGKAKPDFIVCLGDLIDAAKETKIEKKWLAQVYSEFAKLPGAKHFVLGNHCVSTLTKPEFLTGVKQKKSFYSFDAGGYHFVVLDACFRKDGVAYGRNNFD